MLDLGSFQNVNLERWLSLDEFDPKRHLFVVACGYEKRGTAWAARVMTKRPAAAECFQVFGFSEEAKHPSRIENEALFGKYKIPLTTASAADSVVFLEAVTNRVKACIDRVGDVGIHVHVDYSSMPRSWYCTGLLRMGTVLRTVDTIHFWYTPGTYQEGDYPSTGTADFKVFTGKASLDGGARTHMIGLGFDPIRSQAILSVLDPQNLVCFYTDPAVVPGYVEKCLEDNKDILRSSYYKFTVPLNDFVYAYSKIADVARELRRLGDVIIVPEGPKPQILASSIVPRALGLDGITCFHVTRPRNQQTTAIEIDAAGEPVGFMCRPMGT